jgi:hypothetical protein
MASLRRRLSERGIRVRLYALLGCAFYLLALGMVSLKDHFDFVVSDGRGYYAYLSSAVIDGDLDFENQINEHWGSEFEPELLEQKTPLGRIANKYPIGLALTLTPSFLLAHIASLGLHGLTSSSSFEPSGYSALYQLFNLAMVLALGVVMMALIDRLLVERFATTTNCTFGGIALYWLGSHYAYYYFAEPMMVHVVSAFWVTCALYLSLPQTKNVASVNPSESDEQAAWPAVLLGLCCAMAVVSRLSNVVLLLPLVLPRLLSSLRLGTLGLIALGASGPILLQMATWKALWGSWLSYSYGSEGFAHWSSPYLWSTLFSSKHGLFFWSPILLFSMWGLAQAWRTGSRERRAVLLRFGLGFGLLWYLNSSWHMWSFGDAFGGRAFIELSALFAFGLAWCLEGLRQAQLWLVLGLIGVSVLYNYVLMALYVMHWIPRWDYLF